MSAASVDNRPWVERYRPEALDDVVAHEDILSTLRRLMEGDALPHLLFYGPPGTGKTTTVQACARALYGARAKLCTLELNASDDRGIDIIRNAIKDFASTSAVFGARAASTAFKLVILDEADQMSHEAQAALRRVIEKYSRNVRFALLCNHVNKIIPAVQSRCTRFRFAPVKKAAMLPRLKHICATERVPTDDSGVEAAFRICNGDMRRCLNILQATALAHNHITEATVYETTGNPTPTDVRAVLEVMLSQDYHVAMHHLEQMAAVQGVSMADLIRELHGMLLRMTLPQDALCFVIDQLATVETQVAMGVSESSARAAVLGIMQILRESVARNVTVRSLVPRDVLP